MPVAVFVELAEEFDGVELDPAADDRDVKVERVVALDSSSVTVKLMVSDPKTSPRVTGTTLYDMEMRSPNIT